MGEGGQRGGRAWAHRLDAERSKPGSAPREKRELRRRTVSQLDRHMLQRIAPESFERGQECSRVFESGPSSHYKVELTGPSAVLAQNLLCFLRVRLCDVNAQRTGIISGEWVWGVHECGFLPDDAAAMYRGIPDDRPQRAGPQRNVVPVSADDR